MAIIPPFQTVRFILLIMLATLLASCSLTEGEPRVTVCQKVVANLLDVSDIDWKYQEVTTEDQANITVSLSFDVHDTLDNEPHTDSLTASCVYSYSDVAEYEVVGNEYESSPTEVYINDKMVGHYTLTKAINSVMLDTTKGLLK